MSSSLICDMECCARRILNDYEPGRIQVNGSPIHVSAGTKVWRFAVVENGAAVEPDKLHILVDGCGGFTAIIDPDTAHAFKRDGHLSEFEEAVTRRAKI